MLQKKSAILQRLRKIYKTCVLSLAKTVNEATVKRHTRIPKLNTYTCSIDRGDCYICWISLLIKCKCTVSE